MRTLKPFSPEHRNLLLVLAAITLTVISTFGLIARAGSQRTRRPISQLKSELVTVTTRGFEPREITRPAGSFLLMFEDRSGLRALTLELKTQDSRRVKEIRLSRENPDWAEVINLPAGRYVITEPSHPRWTCSLTVTE